MRGWLQKALAGVVDSLLIASFVAIGLVLLLQEGSVVWKGISTIILVGLGAWRYVRSDLLGVNPLLIRNPLRSYTIERSDVSAVEIATLEGDQASGRQARLSVDNAHWNVTVETWDAGHEADLRKAVTRQFGDQAASTEWADVAIPDLISLIGAEIGLGPTADAGWVRLRRWFRTVLRRRSLQIR